MRWIHTVTLKSSLFLPCRLVLLTSWANAHSAVLGLWTQNTVFMGCAIINILQGSGVVEVGSVFRRPKRWFVLPALFLGISNFLYLYQCFSNFSKTLDHNEKYVLHHDPLWTHAHTYMHIWYIHIVVIYIYETKGSQNMRCTFMIHVLIYFYWNVVKYHKPQSWLHGLCCCSSHNLKMSCYNYQF